MLAFFIGGYLWGNIGGCNGDLQPFPYFCRGFFLHAPLLFIFFLYRFRGQKLETTVFFSYLFPRIFLSSSVHLSPGTGTTIFFLSFILHTLSLNRPRLDQAFIYLLFSFVDIRFGFTSESSHFFQLSPSPISDNPAQVTSTSNRINHSLSDHTIPHRRPRTPLHDSTGTQNRPSIQQSGYLHDSMCNERRYIYIQTVILHRPKITQPAGRYRVISEPENPTFCQTCFCYSASSVGKKKQSLRT